MTFTNYNYYKDKYFGTDIPEASFNFYASKASKIVDSGTLGRVKQIIEKSPQPLDIQEYLNVPENIQDCVCSVADILYSQDKPPLQSHTAGGETRVYLSDTKLVKSADERISQSLLTYLEPSLLYRGV